MVKGYDPETGYATVEQRNKMSVGDVVEIFGPGEGYFRQEITEILDEDGNSTFCPSSAAAVKDQDWPSSQRILYFSERERKFDMLTDPDSLTVEYS